MEGQPPTVFGEAVVILALLSPFVNTNTKIRAVIQGRADLLLSIKKSYL